MAKTNMLMREKRRLKVAKKYAARRAAIERDCAREKLRHHQPRHQLDSKLARERCVDYWITVGKILRQRNCDEAHDCEPGGQFKRLGKRQPPEETASCMKKPDICYCQQPEEYSHQAVRDHLPVASNHERRRMEDHGVADDGPRVSVQSLMNTDLSSVKLSSDLSPSSRPMPDCLYPPKGKVASSSE